MSVKYTDSLNKIIEYIDRSGRNGIILSKYFFRDYTCPKYCGGCCPKFSLDYFEGKRWEGFKKTYPDALKYFQVRMVDGVEVYTDFQTDNETRWCRHLDMGEGICKIHKYNPFSCDFELIKWLQRRDKTYLIKKLFGRGWTFKCVDGTVGAKCRMRPFNFNVFIHDIELLKELDCIGKMFKKPTKINTIIKLFTDNIRYIKRGSIPDRNIIIRG